VETIEERVRHLVKLRELQAQSLVAATPASPLCSSHEGEAGVAATKACFNCVIPLSFIPEDSELGNLPGPTGLTDLKTLAIARLMLNNISHIKAFWIMQSIHLSQLSLDWGVDDLDGTVVWYDITKRQGRGVHQELHVEDIKRLIREAGRMPVERDTLYREIRRESANVPDVLCVTPSR
jgi:aminodeoxyfutalosine synthase